MNGLKSKYLLSLVLGCLCMVQPMKAYDYKIENIPDSLKDGAVAIVRNYSAVFTQHDVNSGVYKVSKVITVLNERGKDYATFYSHKDDFVDFKKFEGIVRNGAGKEIKKIKKGDLVESSISSEMATDTRNIFYEVSSPVYPYTVEYNYEQQFKNGIIFYPSFMPITRGGEAVEKAEYRIEIPLGRKIRYLSNFDCKVKEEQTDKFQIYYFSSGPMKAKKNEPLADFSKSLARVRIAPAEFCYDNVCGDLSTWDTFGLWQNKLLQGRDVLPASIVSKVQDLTKDATSDREKVEILYKFLQDNTRYVSIQLGIGGWQPIPAELTIKNNYGDCKGLSNLMMAMLKAVNIPSNYTTIYSGRDKELLEKFPDMAQTNHVILLVPLKSDSIWLECTSNTLPAGYVHDGIAGHDAIVMTDKGGQFCTLPSYTSEENLEESALTINIAADGKINGEMKFTEHVHGFGNYHNMMKSNEREGHVKFINWQVNFPRLNIGTIKTSEQLSALPSCTLEADFTADNYVTKTGQRMFIPLIPLKKNYYTVFKAKERVHDIVISQGFSEKDSITVNLPEGYVVESKPKDAFGVSPYGFYHVKVTQLSENTITYSTYVNIKEGYYSKDEYDDIKSFFQKIAAVYKARIVVKNETT